MTRTRSLLLSTALSVALAALLLAAAPALADPGAPVVPSATAAPATASAPESGQCTPAPQTAVAALAAPDPGLLFLSAPGGSDFILCSCKFCKTHQDVICRISPTGFSIFCSDYYASHCL